MPRSRATCATGCAESRPNRTASALNASVYRRLALVIMLSSDFITLLLIQVSVKSGEGQSGLICKTQDLTIRTVADIVRSQRELISPVPSGIILLRMGIFAVFRPAFCAEITRRLFRSLPLLSEDSNTGLSI